MAPLSQLSGHINSTCGAENSTGASRARPHAYYALSYCVLILAIVFGNGLVCVAVLRERALQTTTNYLVVSLAVADLLVATLVMPWVVYLEVSKPQVQAACVTVLVLVFPEYWPSRFKMLPVMIQGLGRKESPSHSPFHKETEGLRAVIIQPHLPISEPRSWELIVFLGLQQPGDWT